MSDSSSGAGSFAAKPGRPRAVFLVGFMGAGKTSVGVALSLKLGWIFEDLDDRIEAREGRTIQRIFEESGEAGFREAETAALRQVAREFQASLRVIALGGGAFAQSENMALIAQTGVPVVFLDAPARELFRRCRAQDKERPLCREFDQFQALYEQRRLAYEKASHRVATSGKDIDSIATEVACSLGLI
jgi:shikimate kinase